METAISFNYWIRRKHKVLDLTQQVLKAPTHQHEIFRDYARYLGSIDQFILAQDQPSKHLTPQTEDRNAFAFNVVATKP
jgi:hypothetical protein